MTKAKAIVASIASYIAGYLDSDWELLVIVENKDGERFWSGKGRLRNEFAHGRKVENRSWGMYEVQVCLTGAVVILFINIKLVILT